MVQAQIWCINSETNRMQTINYYVHHTTGNVSKFDIIDASGVSMMSYIVIVWCCMCHCLGKFYKILTSAVTHLHMTLLVN